MTPFERLFKFCLKTWVVLGYLGLVILSFLYFDKPIATLFNNLHLRTDMPILNYLTALGINKIYFIGLLLVALFFRYIYSNKLWETRAWFLWLCVLFPTLVCAPLKVFLGRARPDLWFSDHLYGLYWYHTSNAYWSLPSGHTTTVIGLMMGLAVIFPRYSKTFFITGFILAGLRVILVHHYLSDVLVASYLATVEIGLLLMVFKYKKWRLTNA